MADNSPTMMSHEQREVASFHSMDVEPSRNLTGEEATGPENMKASITSIKTDWENNKDKHSTCFYFLSYEPMQDQEHVELFKEILHEGGELGTHLHPTKLSLSTFGGEKYFQEIGLLTFEELDELIGILTETFKEKFGFQPLSFRSGSLSYNDHLAAVLVKHGYRADFSSVTGRVNNNYGSNWAGAYPYAHLANSANHFVPGDLPLVRIPLSVDREVEIRDGERRFHPDGRPDFCAIPGWQARYPTTWANICRQIVEDNPAHPYTIDLTHNETDFNDLSTPKAQAMHKSRVAKIDAYRQFGFVRQVITFEDFLDRVEKDPPAPPQPTIAKAPFDATRSSAADDRPPFHSIRVSPEKNNFGARIQGFDFEKYGPAELADLKKALQAHRVLLLDDAEISETQLARFAGDLGTISMSTDKDKMIAGEYPRDHGITYIYITSDFGTHGPNPYLSFNHIDTYRTPPSTTILLDRPNSNHVERGFRSFCDMRKIFNDLWDSHKADLAGRYIEFPEVIVQEKCCGPSKWARARQPIVRTDPDTGKHALYLGHKTPRAIILGLPAQKSEGILQQVWGMTEELQYRWTPEISGGMTIIDNKSVMVSQLRPANGVREFLKVTIDHQEPLYIN
ncbi:hypothetical protein HFN63_33105 [Rhizobium leguminosarum]|uniref:TauD/TfdA family dioxygenase n=1 Tax=Rhizobium leguminosarum TaxID=384 RepID=UPI001C96558F|nr:TauD/TfdA family dioxygenase [Rhizobium leguminosarum]MBY5774867.1 hypothetical protein [Rhizobium leguminosarum]